jgi:L-alanine-DL-glutamate epimerase-like enolase superfamily enzyme
MDVTIASVESWACSLPLDIPLSFGAYTLTKREYTVVRLRTHGGLEAAAIGLSRGLPVDVAATDVFAPLLIGTDGTDVVARTRDRNERLRVVERTGVAAFAWSLLDVCLWDMQAQAAGAPLWAHLGAVERTLPVLLVEGYALPGEDDAAFAARLADRTSAGVTALKIEGASAADPASLRRRLETVREAVGDGVELVVDLAWKHLDASAAAADIAEWAHVRPCWVEDPFPRERVGEYVRLRRLNDAPVGCGDEMTREDDLAGLIEERALDVVRVDATTIGGVTAALRLASRASAAGLRLSAHAHPEIHRHLVLTWDTGAYLESFPADRPFDLENRLLAEPLEISNGMIAPPQSAGTGIRLDEAAVERYAVRRAAIR